MAEIKSPDLKALFQVIEKGEPALQCLSEKPVRFLCISRKCQASACFCLDRKCSNCFGPHRLCECVHLQSLTELLQDLFHKHQKFRQELSSITEELILEIRKKMKSLEEETYQRYFTQEELEGISAIYLSESALMLKGDSAKDFYRKMVQTPKQAESLQYDVLNKFSKEAKKIVGQLKKFSESAVNAFSEKFKVQILRKSLKKEHLGEAQEAKHNEEITELTKVRKHSEEEDMRMDDGDLVGPSKENSPIQREIDPNEPNLRDQEEQMGQRQQVDEDTSHETISLSGELKKKEAELEKVTTELQALKKELVKMNEVKYLLELEKRKVQQLQTTNEKLKANAEQLQNLNNQRETAYEKLKLINDELTIRNAQIQQEENISLERNMGIHSLFSKHFFKNVTDIPCFSNIDLFRTKIMPPQKTDYIRFIYQSLTNPKVMKLIFRASEHGFMATKFHEHCDGQKDTFTLIKTEFGKIIAGFTPVKWESPEKAKQLPDSSPKSFLLSCDLQEKMTLYSNYINYSIYCQKDLGPSFGSYDIRISDRCDLNKSSTNFPVSYNCNNKYKKNQETWTKFCGNPNGQEFTVVDYEVYTVRW